MHTANVFRVVCGERDREIEQGEQSNKNKNINLFVRRFGLSALVFGRQIDINRKTERDRHIDRCRGRYRDRHRDFFFLL